MLNKLSEIIAAVSHLLHIIKPVVFELVLFAWAMVELFRFMLAVVMGHGGGAQ